MPNEIAYYDDENGNRSYFADDTAREQISALQTGKFNNGVHIEGTTEYTISSTRTFDTLLVVGGWGSSNVILDVIFLNTNPAVLKLGNSTSTITAVSTTSCKYKTTSQYFSGTVISTSGATLTVS